MQNSQSKQGISMGIFGIKDLLGSQVKNPQGESLGKIEDIVIDTDIGQVAYAVLSFGGFLGLGDKLFAIPWQALSLEPAKGVLASGQAQVFILNVDKEQLEKAPSFGRDNLIEMTDPNFGPNVYSYYGYKPYR
jgi:sporulation protein YlmC with PRC-barrel domain